MTARLRHGRTAREQFIDSHLGRCIVQQLKATRDQLNWSQQQLAETAGMTQNAISRLESPDYGKPTITTLKRLAAAMDVGLVVHFAPFSQIIDWVSGTPRVDRGLNTNSLAVPAFSREDEAGIFDTAPPRVWEVESSTSSGSFQRVDFTDTTLCGRATANLQTAEFGAVGESSFLSGRKGPSQEVAAAASGLTQTRTATGGLRPRN